MLHKRILEDEHVKTNVCSKISLWFNKPQKGIFAIVEKRSKYISG